MRAYRDQFYFVMFACFSGLFVLKSEGELMAQTSQRLPDFSFVTHDGEEIKASSFDDGQPLIVIYFEPTCSHCQLQAEWIANEEKFEEINVLWVAWQATDGIPDFVDRYFPQAGNMYFVIDSEEKFDSLFGFSQIPTLYVYDSDQLLIRKYKSEVKPARLLKVLNKRTE